MSTWLVVFLVAVASFTVGYKLGSGYILSRWEKAVKR